MSSNVENSETTALDGASCFALGSSSVLALLSASCCVLPVGLSIIGLGGSWLTVLGPFVAYRTEILVGVGAILAWSGFRLWQRWRCASRRRSSLLLFGFAALSFTIAGTSPIWENEAARTMFVLWRQTR